CFSTDIFLLSTNVLRLRKLGPEVTRRDLMTALPYDNEIFEISLSGKKLKDMLRHMYRKEAWEGANVFFILSGTVKLTVRREDKEILSMEYRGGQPDEERMYTVGINTYAYRNMEEFLGITAGSGDGRVSVRRLCTNDKEELELFFKNRDHFTLKDEGRLTLV
ncbi:MAG: 5'-nucleotidase C-terminal domain-containing protein, partial [Lachnospiraceae bacterium]|nr:5'-nucleotidase C-terminal domain-containing protein [Lachnospiraceae bacterium]